MTGPSDVPIPEAIPCTTAFEILGFGIEKHPALAWGVLVRSLGFTKGFTGGFHSRKAGEVPQYTDVVSAVRIRPA